MKKIEQLRDLQELDTALDGIGQELEEGRSRLGDDAVLVPLREELAAAEQQLRLLRSRGRDLEDELETKTSRRKAEEKKLYDGSVKNPKELGSLAHEVETAGEQISKLEDQALLNMDETEAASALVQAARASLSDTERAWKSEQAQLSDRRDALSREAEESGARREGTSAQIDSPALRLYESIRRTRGGLAVVPIVQRTCRGCRITLSSSEVQRARSSPDLVTCQSCGRILYVP